MQVCLLREELHHLQESGSYVGEVVKPMGKNKILVKVSKATSVALIYSWCRLLHVRQTSVR
jgi:ATP-dependent 26S proteasome regulatory subunit